MIRHLLAAATAVAAASPVAAQGDIAADRIARHVEVLAHDSLRGRATPSPGLDASARYVAAELERAGVRPIGRSLVARWPMVTRTRVAAGVRLTASGPGAGAPDLVYGKDYAVMAAGVPEIEGRLVAVPSLADTAAVRGTIPLLRIPAREWSGPAHAALREGRRVGAVAVALVLDSAGTLEPVAAAAIRMDHATVGVPAILLSREGAARLTAGGIRDIRLRIPERADTTMAPWVLGRLEGTELADEHVVVSAHLDHLGVGAPDERGDSVYNGADDNASGVAALLEIARALGAAPPRRSILFFAPAAEEVCICGSEHFTREPPVPLETIVADVNLDGIGRSWEADTVSAEGSAYSTLGGSVRAVAARHPELRLTVVDDQWPDRSYFLTSDQIWFARRGVPSLFLSSTGPDRHYHRPSDETATIEPELTARIARLAGWLVRDVADAERRPAWAPAARAQIVLPR